MFLSSRNLEFFDLRQSRTEPFKTPTQIMKFANTKYLTRFAGQSPAPVTRNEHTACLLYWLCHNLFYTRSQKINRDFVPIAIGLANCEKLALGVYFLAFVYREIFDSIKPLSSGEGLAIGSGLRIYFPSRCRTSLDIDSAHHFDTYGLALGCPKPISSGHPYEFSNYFKVFYESRPHHLISWSPFAERVTGPSWLLTRYEAIQGELASSRASEYSDVCTGQIFYGQYCVNRPPTKSTTEADRLAAIGNRLQCFFKLVSFRPNHIGVVGFPFTTSWDAFCERNFVPIASHALHKVLHLEAEVNPQPILIDSSSSNVSNGSPPLSPSVKQTPSGRSSRVRFASKKMSDIERQARREARLDKKREAERKQT
uniref:Aminotransferase-like plant mobile domain-containing protein n=1 Tax=Ananas comosus var. bracteatus TaxID=296719 RepID=A0A6V7NWY5_ANACO|nr:unnamed protein product [Ananas comosus var. bracteatus]